MKMKNDMIDFALETNVNPYLLGKYEPIHDEVFVENLEVIEGEVPKDINGIYVRNGPNPKYETRGRYHWFDGDGMLHSVQLRDGKVSYRNRWIKTAAFEREAAVGESIWFGRMESMVKNPKDMPLKDTSNTDVVFHNKQLMTLWYMSGKPYKVDPQTLETLGIEDFGGKYKNNISAHTKVDEQTGDLMFFDYGPLRSSLTYGVVSASGILMHCVDVDLPGPRLPHDMAITENYSILMDLPLFADSNAISKGRYKVEFHRDVPSRFGIFPRFGSNENIRWFEAEPCYIYHTINSWEEGDEIVLLGCRVEEPMPEVTKNACPLARMLAYLQLNARLYYWRFNLTTGVVKEGLLDDINTEFPTVNLNFVGRKSRYTYNVHISNEQTLSFDGLVKYDTEKQNSETLMFGKGRYGNEAAFAPRQYSNSEDDGYLVTFVHDEVENQSELLIIDALNFANGAIARVKIPVNIPIGFHACWVPGEKID
ncbi:carotenoid oxygenase family protein [Bacillus sp. SCS-151]|uniref:carotenoid oxygenase family protein n=1 Tax=Nanhaiella sioensis TaxID=3115293 RepID=UPI00397DADBA